MIRIPYGRQEITPEDIEKVTEALQDDFITQGPQVMKFENLFAAYVKAKYGVAVSNGTAALHISNMALNVQPGDKVITTPITFVASANSVLFCGGTVDFVDIDPRSYLMDLSKLEKKLSRVPKGTYKGIIPVDFAGYPVNMEKLRQIADRYDLWILEDACHAPGGYFVDTRQKKSYCGSGELSDVSIFSFHPVKHIATGEGGMVTTRDKNLYEKLLLFRNHGITKDPTLLHENHGGWYYEMQELGYNYRLTDIQAALGMSQLARAKKNLEKRNTIAKIYNEAFKNSPVLTPHVETGYYHAYHLYVVQVANRKGLYDHLREHGIYAQIHYIPVHLQPYYQNMGWGKGDFPIAEKYYEKAISLPMYPTLTQELQQFVIDKVLEFVS
ncbi:MAG: UDP-4-amino-4,6-dideoxy-N-acetyl-beta-L-altrosamine transaminase [Bacteroidales bacterium]|nr:UDP-4-amino-4,6-dideoxy-N-acetyl-beta-L-altrosamine transaminase [Bacteroidales bacterium]